jgi:hypothetical protein
MNRSLVAHAALVASALICSACAEHRDPTGLSGLTLVAPRRADTLFVALADNISGDEGMVVATVNVSVLPGARPIASFLGEVHYDPRQLQFVSDVAIPGVSVASNPTVGRVIIAGASAQGIADGRLYAARFRVIQRGTVAAIDAQLQELNDAAYAARIGGVQRGNVRPDRTAWVVVP